MNKLFEKISSEEVSERLREAGLRPTKQRLQLAALLWSGACADEGDCCHVTAEELHRAAMDAQIKVSLATIYNTLHQFTSHGLLREIVVDRGRSYFDTNVKPHHHFLHEETGELIDIPDGMLDVVNLPTPPAGMTVSDVDVIVRVSSK